MRAIYIVTGAAGHLGGTIVRLLSRAGVPLFFMLSGAVLALRPLGRFDAVVQSKIKRLIIPYFVYGWLFMLPVKYIGHFYSRESVLQAMQGLLSGQDAGHLWFLTALFWCLIK